MFGEIQKLEGVGRRKWTTDGGRRTHNAIAALAIMKAGCTSGPANHGKNQDLRYTSWLHPGLTDGPAGLMRSFYHSGL